MIIESFFNLISKIHHHRIASYSKYLEFDNLIDIGCHKGEFLTFTSFSWVQANDNFRRSLGGFEVNFPITEQEVAMFKQLETLKRSKN